MARHLLPHTPVQSAAQRSAEVPEISDETYLQHADLEPDIGCHYREQALQPISEIFLTGANGFVGAHLLLALQRAFPKAQLTCLVRGDSDQGAQARLWDALKQYRLDSQVVPQRLKVCSGDLASPRLGLAPAHYQHLQEHCDLIVHNAASVHHLHSFATLAAANTQSTRACLRLACEGRAKRVAYISTLTLEHSSYPRNPGENFIREEASIYGGYAQSKWVSERLLAQARERGMHVTVIRPGGIGGHSQTGLSSPWASNHLLSLIGACLSLQKGPDIHLELDVLPVDWVAQLCAAAMQEDQPRVYNLTHYPKMTWRDLMQWLDSHVSALQLVPLQQWQSEVLPNLSPQHPFAPLKKLYQSGYLARVEKWHPVTEFANTRALCEKHGLPLPILQSAHLAVWFGWLSRQGLLAPAAKGSAAQRATAAEPALALG